MNLLEAKRIIRNIVKQIISEAIPLSGVNYKTKSDAEMLDYIHNRKKNPYSMDKKKDPNQDKMKDRPYIHRSSIPVLNKEGNHIYIKNAKGKTVKYTGVANAIQKAYS
jgi:hypothetical protein